MSDFPCDQCKKTFKELAQLIQHRAASHAAGTTDSGERLVCTFCLKSFLTEPAMQQHIDAAHKDSKPKISNTNIPTKNVATPSIGKTLTSFFGNFMYPSSSEKETFECKPCIKTFPSEEILHQHQRDKHKTTNNNINSSESQVQHPAVMSSVTPQTSNECSVCNTKCMSQQALQQHTRDKHSKDERPELNTSTTNPGKVKCNSCNRIYPTEEAMLQHTRDSHPHTLSASDRDRLSKSKPYPCMHCKDSFDSGVSLKQHVLQKHNDLVDGMGELSMIKGNGLTGNGASSGSRSDEHVCTTCYNTFTTGIAAAQHQDVKKNHVVKMSTRPLAVDCFLKAACVEVDDKQASVALFRDIIKKIMDIIRKTKRGKVYSPDVASAGSTAVNVKIGKADEFDTNIPLNIPVKKLVTDGTIDYIYEDKIDEYEGQKSKINMNVDRKIVKCGNRRIPDGQAVVKVDDGSVHSELVYGEDLIPHKCQKDLYDNVKAAIIELNLEKVKLSREAHGPAITLTIVPENGHNISVDMTLSLACNMKVSKYGWPRDSTKRAFRPQQIEECLKAPMHLVPKGGDTWSISFSKVEETLINGIDTGNGCRRHVMQIMKRHLQICASASKKGLEGISSYVVKQQILWSAEKYTTSGYWDSKNMDRCVIDVMGDLIGALKEGKLPLYFKPSVNTLQHKRRDILNILVRYFEAERVKLLNME